MPGPAFCFSFVAICGGFVYLSFPRWVLGVDGRPFGTSPGTPRNPAEPHGTVKLGNYDWGPEFYGFVAHRFGLPSAPPARGGFVYLSFPRWVLGVDGRPSERRPEPHGNPKNATDR